MTPKRTSTKKTGAAAPKRAAAVAAAGPLGAEGEDGDKPLVTEGFVRITIKDTPFELRGTVGEHVVVAWHKPFEQGVDLGSVTELMGGVAEALGVAKAESFTAELNAKLDKVKGLPIVGNMAAIVESASVKITDLGIDTRAGKYQFGFGWDLSSMDASYNGISLDAFGLVFTYTRPAS